MVGMVEMVNTIKACGARLCEGTNLRSRHTKTICATTCPIWSNLLTNYEYYRLCVFLDGVGIGMVIRPAHLVQEGAMGKP
jgi:hypothetical protein